MFIYFNLRSEEGITSRMRFKALEGQEVYFSGYDTKSEYTAFYITPSIFVDDEGVSTKHQIRNIFVDVFFTNDGRVSMTLNLRRYKFKKVISLSDITIKLINQDFSLDLMRNFETRLF